MPEATIVRDPVCNMVVDPAKTPHHAHHAGHDYHFCGARCREKFLADPDRYLGETPPSPPPALPGTVWTCPMHPEIRQDHPGDCPKCGMALEPDVPGEQEDDSEYRDMRRRFLVGLVLTLPVFALEMGAHLFPALHHVVPPGPSHWLQALLATPVVLWAGAPFFARGWRSVRNRHLNMFTLIAMGTGVAWVYSLAALLLPDAFPSEFRDAHGVVPVYFEAAAVITVLVLAGQLLELRARARTSGAIRALLDLTPKTARRITPAGDEDVPVAAIALGDRLRLRPGESVPVDGIVEDGRSTLDESLVTGEAMPLTRAPGDPVIAGTLNGSGALVIRATRVGAETMLARIVQLVAQAQRSRAPVQRLADAVAAWFVPAVLAVALVAFAVWALYGPPPRLAHALVAAVSVLIVACPCALGLATPMSIVVGVGRGARSGVLIRDAEALETLGKVDTLVLDKTGTLTQGRPAVTAIAPATGYDEDTVLRLAAAVEILSEHPLAAAIAAAAKARDLVLPAATDFTSPAGKGATAAVAGETVTIGNAAWLAERGIDPAPLHTAAERFRSEGATAVLVGHGQRPAGVIAIADPIKPTTPEALASLRAAGLHIIMLTGDHHTTANAVAARLGIADVHAEVLPEAKHALIETLRAQGHVVAMAGDGVNDAPALASAHVGIAMGTGTDVAIASSGITLPSGDLAMIVRARNLSRATLRNIRQNLFLAFAYNAAAVPLAAGALYPWTGLVLSPEVAAAAMALSSASVITNALRLRKQRLD